MDEQQITALAQIREGDVLMFHSASNLTEQNPEGSRELIRIDGHVPEGLESLVDFDPYLLMEQTGNVLPVSVRCPTLTGSLRITKMGGKYLVLDAMNTEGPLGEPGLTVKNFMIRRTQLESLLHTCPANPVACYRIASRGMAWHPESSMFNPYVIAAPH